MHCENAVNEHLHLLQKKCSYKLKFETSALRHLAVGVVLRQRGVYGGDVAQAGGDDEGIGVHAQREVRVLQET